MCEVLLVVRNANARHRSAKDLLPIKRGDIVVVAPDGWRWGRREIANPDWRIIQIPGKHETDFSGWCEEAHSGDQVVLKRKFYVNLDCDEAKWLTDSIATNKAVSLSIDEVDKFMALKTARNSPFAEEVCLP